MKGVINPLTMLDGSGTTIHYSGNEDACRACNNKFTVFGMYKYILLNHEYRILII